MPGSRADRKIILIGMMGSGKTTVGRIIADKSALPFIDSDDVVSSRAGRSISMIFEQGGEAEFRRLECEVLQAALAEPGAAVIATGGGAVLDPRNVEAMHQAGDVFWLTAGLEEIRRRLAGSADRPLYNTGAAPAMLAARERAYMRAGDMSISTDGRQPGEIASEILPMIAGKGVLRTVPVQAGRDCYSAHFGWNLLGGTAEHVPMRHALLVSNDRVAPLYMKRLRDGLGQAGVRVSSFVLPDGEEHKSLEWLQRLYDWGLSERADRRSVVVALGGGVVGDLAGFFAATLLRGIRIIQVPTTVVAQVDSSIGGKTAVNHPRGKNLIGAFHHPSAVVSDLATIPSLPRRELSAGLAEVIKHAAIDDEKYFMCLEEKLERLLNIERLSTLELLARSCQIKAKFVSRDPLDQGERAVLNFGHTVGHAVETAAGFGRYRHGEAVAVGMVAAAHISEHLGMIGTEERLRIQKLLERAGLPVSIPSGLAGGVAEAIGSDKKSVDGRLRWVVLHGIGRPAISDAVTPALLRDVLKEMSSSDTGVGDPWSEPQPPGAS